MQGVHMGVCEVQLMTTNKQLATTAVQSDGGH